MNNAIRIRDEKMKHVVYIVLMIVMLLGVPVFNATAMLFGASTPIINLDE